MSQPLAQNSDELFDVVDEQDIVVRKATRGEVHAHDWLHRAVHIWVFRPDGDLLLQMRSAAKDQYPSTWTSSASGHVDAGETYETAAVRELQEELGLMSSLKPVVKLPAGPETAFEFTQLFVTLSNEQPRPNPVEVASVEWWPVTAAVEAAEQNPETFSPPLRELLAWWRENRQTSV